MRKDKIHIIKAAERDMNNALNYIEFVLKNPAAADTDTLFDEATSRRNALTLFPGMLRSFRLFS